MANVGRRAGCLALGAAATVAFAVTGCGKAQDEPGPRSSDLAALSASPPAPGWTPYHHDRRRGYALTLPTDWHRARHNLTRGISDPLERFTVATFPLRADEQLCGERRAALDRVRPAGALVTIQERGRGDHSPSQFPARPAKFRADPGLPGHSTWPYCAAKIGDPPVPMEDYWFGFRDAGRVFHVLVAIGKTAPAKVRSDAFRILDELRIDPSVRPGWVSSG